MAVPSFQGVVYALKCCFLSSSNFLVHFPKTIFLCSLDVKLWKKYGWHFFGGHLGCLAAILIFFTENRVCHIFQLLIDGFARL